MINYKLQPLTEEEKAMAEKYHNLVYTFLHQKGYSIEEYYDIAVMGYLKAVQKYSRDDNLKLKWSFKAICYNDMHREIGNQTKKENTKKRMPEGGFTSLDLQLENSNESFINSIVTQTLEDEFFAEYDRLEEADRIKDILSQLTDIQRKIAILKASGKPVHYISKKLHISLKAVNEEMKKARGEQQTELILQEPDRKVVANITEYIGVPTDIILTLKLSARQLDVLNLLMIGHKESDIGRELGISRQAVYDAVKKIRQKAEKVR